MSILTSLEVRALRYVANTAGNANISDFDEDHEPIGPSLRAQLMPTYVTEHDGIPNAGLRLTEAGLAALDAATNGDRK